MKKKVFAITLPVVILVSVLLYIFVFRKDLSGKIVMPYIVHQRGVVDPHIQGAVPLADQLDEVLFDGLFNVSANRSGVVYEDGLAELVGIDALNVVSVKLKTGRKWHSSYRTKLEKGIVTIEPGSESYFEAKDLQFSLNRIRMLGSLSPDYIMISQAVPDFSFSGPDEENIVRFQFRGDRIWSQSDIKEILSFKIIPSTSGTVAGNYSIGTGPYLEAGELEGVRYFNGNPAGAATISSLLIKPYIDNSTFITELKNRNINALIGTPFGEISPILADTSRYFYKSTIATTFFALLFNTQKLSLEQRKSLRALIDNSELMEKFFRVGTRQQRQIANYKGSANNYEDYVNKSVFPSTSYYIGEEIVVPGESTDIVDLSVLPDTIRVQTCLNYQYREELAEIINVLNDPAFAEGRIKASAVTNPEIAQGEYHAVLVPFSGYRSNFLFDLYSVFLQEPDFSTNRINLVTSKDKNGRSVIAPSSFAAEKNYFRIDLSDGAAQNDAFASFLYVIYDFMSTNEIGDKQMYAMMVHQQEEELALGKWLFSLPSLSYFNSQFDAESIDLYGTASQMSTIENWKELKK